MLKMGCSIYFHNPIKGGYGLFSSLISILTNNGEKLMLDIIGSNGSSSFHPDCLPISFEIEALVAFLSEGPHW